MKRRLEVAPGCFCDVPANVTTLHSIDDAWERYRALVQAQRDDERLLTDMAHQIAVIRAHSHWRRLYMQTEQAG
jgi:hypothetical protein